MEISKRALYWFFFLTVFLFLSLRHFKYDIVESSHYGLASADSFTVVIPYIRSTAEPHQAESRQMTHYQVEPLTLCTVPRERNSDTLITVNHETLKHSQAWHLLKTGVKLLYYVDARGNEESCGKRPISARSARCFRTFSNAGRDLWHRSLKVGDWSHRALPIRAPPLTLTSDTAGLSVTALASVSIQAADTDPVLTDRALFLSPFIDPLNNLSLLIFPDKLFPLLLTFILFLFAFNLTLWVMR